MTVAKKIESIRKSIELQKRIRTNIEKSRLDGIPVEILDVERMLAQCDEIILTLENRMDAIGRRAKAAA